jgi:hypothetical protein
MPFWPDLGILRREFVAVLAVGLAGVLSRRANAAEDVDGLGYGFEVSRVDATANAAQMVDLQSCRD